MTFTADPTLPYRRVLLLRAVDPHTVVGDLEDDFHHFRVTLAHADGVVTSVQGEALRFPWTTCPDAAVPLHELEGMALTDRMTAAAAHSDPRMNCTHMFDAACLAVTHAYRGTPTRRYDVELWLPAGGRSRMHLRRDGEDLFTWEISDGVFTNQLPWSEGPWRGGFLRWADSTLPPEDAEAAIVARRVCDIGMGRTMDLEAFPTAEGLLWVTEGACYTMRTGVAEHAHRMRGTIRDFGADPDAMLSS